MILKTRSFGFSALAAHCHSTSTIFQSQYSSALNIAKLSAVPSTVEIFTNLKEGSFDVSWCTKKPEGNQMVSILLPFTGLKAYH